MHRLHDLLRLIEFAFLNHDSGSGFDHDLGVSALVIVGRGCERNKERWLAGGGQFGDGGCATPGKNQVRSGELRGHVVQEWLDSPA